MSRSESDAAQPARADWVEVFRALGEALIDVVRAEIAVLSEQWKRSGKAVGFVLACALFALLSAALIFTLLVYATIHFIADFWELPIWGGALIVVALIAILVAIAGAIAGYIWKKGFENPLDSTKRRWSDHIGWWHEKLLQDMTEELPAAKPDASGGSPEGDA